MYSMITEFSMTKDGKAGNEESVKSIISRFASQWMNAYGEQMLLHASVPPHSARLVCNQLTALTWKHVSVWRHTQTRHHQNNLPLFFSPPASFSFSSLEAQPPLSPAIYLGTTSAKMGQGRPSFSCLFLSNPAHRYISLAVLCLSESQGHLQPN